MPTTPILNLPYPTSADTADVPRDLQSLALAIDPLGTLPVGALLLWPTAIAPTAFLLCKGQQVDAAIYPALALVLGSTAGQIAIPDFQNLFPIGAGTDAAVLQTGGAREVALSGVQVGSHNHGSAATTYDGGHNHGGLTGFADRSLAHSHTFHGLVIPGFAAGSSFWPMGLGTGYAVPATNTGGQAYMGDTDPNPAADHAHGIPGVANHNHSVTIQDSPAATPHENRPPFRAVNFMIRAL